MNGAERLQAAIDKLEQLRAGAEPVRDDSAWVIDYHVTEEGMHIYVLDSHNGGYDGAVVADVTSETRAELIVTLHRTIPELLAILRHSALDTTSPDEPAALDDALALADAILGGAS